MKKNLIVALVATCFISLFFWIFFSSTTKALPKPTGSFPIGTTVYNFIDYARKEVHSQNSADQRELIVQIWYPAEPTKGKGTQPYIDPQSLQSIKKDLRAHFNATEEQLAVLGKIKTHAMKDVPISKMHASYPVVLFSPGFGSPVAFYTSLLEELASHGYIVAAISYPYITSAVSFPDGRLINYKSSRTLKDLWKLNSEEQVAEKEQSIWVDDILFVWQQLKNINSNDPHNILTQKMDLLNGGLFGHSFGGGASVSACPFLSSCKAVVNIDGRTLGPHAEKGFNIPSMFIRNPIHKQQKEQSIRTLWHNMTGPSYYVIIEGSLHGSFGDFFLFISLTGEPALKLDPKRGIEISRTLLLNFFDKYLKDSSVQLESIKEQYPEVNFQVKK